MFDSINNANGIDAVSDIQEKRKKPILSTKRSTERPKTSFRNNILIFAVEHLLQTNETAKGI